MVADRVSGHDEVSAAPWFVDRAAWRFVARGYLPRLAVMSLGWEIAHSPLYTLWRDATAEYIAFAVAHCTLGDILIGAAALLLALVILRQRALARCGSGGVSPRSPRCWQSPTPSSANG